MAKRKGAFRSYDEAANWLSKGRWPNEVGREYVSRMRLYQRDGHIAIHHDNWRNDECIAKLTPDNVLELVATPQSISARGTSLSQQLEKVVPFRLCNFAVGRYKVVHMDEYKRLPEWKDYSDWGPRHQIWLDIRREAHEYFMGMRLDLSTGMVINTKDMTPNVDEDKRKQWTAGLKAVRLRLRAMERVGVFDQYAATVRSYAHNTRDDMVKAAEIIMTGEAPQELVEIIARNTSNWKAQQVGVGKAMMTAFENMLKSNSREMRLHVGVITLKED